MNPFVASPSTTITTTTRQPTTTRPRGSILFFERTTTRAPSSGRSETGCRAVGRWRGRPGMDAWCSSNCRRFHCPRGVCTCESPRWQNKLPFIFCVGRVGNRINEWFEAGQELEGGWRSDVETLDTVTSQVITFGTIYHLTHQAQVQIFIIERIIICVMESWCQHQPSYFHMLITNHLGLITITDTISPAPTELRSWEVLELRQDWGWANNNDLYLRGCDWQLPWPVSS